MVRWIWSFATILRKTAVQSVQKIPYSKRKKDAEEEADENKDWKWIEETEEKNKKEEKGERDLSSFLWSMVILNIRSCQGNVFFSLGVLRLILNLSSESVFWLFYGGHEIRCFEPVAPIEFSYYSAVSAQAWSFVERKKKRILVVVIKWHHRAKANNWDIEGLYYFNKISSISTSTLFIKNGIKIDWPRKIAIANPVDPV